MNILVFTTAFFPSIGGLENQTLNLLNEFIKHGHNVKVIAIQSESTKNLIRISDAEVEVNYNPNTRNLFSLFVWCNIFYMPNFSLKGIGFLPFRPFKRWIVSHNDLYLSNTRDLTTRLKLLAIKLASRNISVSNSVAKYIKTNSTIIYNCYDNDAFKIYPEEKREFNFVFLGRLVSQKGCKLLINACKNLQQPFTLNIIGDGPERKPLEDLVKALSLEESIKFLGIHADEQLARLLNKHQTLIIPSIEEEGFGIVALEGLACGCKIIAAKAGGLTEAVNGFGNFFEMNNQQELESLLLKDLEESNEKRSYKVSNELQTYLSGHSKKIIAEKYLQLFTT